ncbi:hypothetical protein HPB48_026441 [Haemaphysalis longicornis]|uniref:Uncharacterized protein n=1 Tax=Haemaphysalis longicornis TaxID=44386 RepID=A0A9J6HBF7_HAELO|nr:hypothetical protein HPB48_026441 [Haemaphysalis longicornis]
MPGTPVDVVDQAAPPMPEIVGAGSIRKRDPSFIHGERDHDVEDWLSTYEKVSSRNTCDDPGKFHNLEFYITQVGFLWFSNNARDFRIWVDFETRFCEVFVSPSVLTLRAEHCPRGRAKKQGNNFSSFIKDVVDLYRRIDVAPSEEDKVKHI